MGSFDEMIGTFSTIEFGFNPQANCVDGFACYVIETMEMCMGNYVNLSSPSAPLDNQQSPTSVS